ncbi:hypothetical protein [Sphingopyxis sp. BSNA05]|uniref:hypothetical protein n=1 Tax=Sphingopyxis sp. BSNA05 TaxID=1236614 RepID=UPI0015650B59|nr:hypothetical protein [Sphingopyxis sp. BSNA05]
MIHEQKKETKSASNKTRYEKPILIELDLAKESDAKSLPSPFESGTRFNPS